MIRYLLLILPLFFWQADLHAQKHKKRGKCRLTLVDSMSLSPSARLMFYWWDPYHLHTSKKSITPYNVDETTFANKNPPYTYKFKLKRGLQEFSILSCFNDSIHFNLELEGDTILYFQHLVKDYYQLIDSSQTLLQEFKSEDLVTLYLARIYPDNFHALRLDFHYDSNQNIQIDLINRKPPKKLDAFEQDNFLILLQYIEPLARKLEKADDQHGYFVVIRKNKKVIEYKGKLGGGKINAIIGSLESLLSVPKP